MNLWILDTDHFSLLLQGHPGIVRQIATVESQAIYITINTVEEQLRGRLNTIRQASTNITTLDNLIQTYTKLEITVERFKTLNILGFRESAGACYRELVRQKIRIGTRDLRIASIALSVNGTVLTRNRRDFEKVPGLCIEDWTVL